MPTKLKSVNPLSSAIKKRNIKYIVAFLFVITGFFGFFFIEGPALIILFILAMLSILLLFNIPSKWIEDSFATISYRFKISSAVAGGVFLAVASSSPEFFTATSGVVWYRIFAIGFDTLIWSAIFNLCVIIGVGTFYKPVILVRKSILRRDMPFFGIAILLILFLAIDGVYTRTDFLLLISLYIVYVIFLYYDKSRPYKDANHHLSWTRIIIQLIVGLIAIAFLAHAMVSIGQETIGLLDKFYHYSLPLGVLACTIYGPGTSVADLFMSIAAIKKGEDTAAIVNGISSNTFDLTICIGIPGLIYAFITGEDILIDLESSFLIIAILLVSFILVFSILYRGKITKKSGIGLLLFYGLSSAIYLIYILNTH